MVILPRSKTVPAGAKKVNQAFGVLNEKYKEMSRQIKALVRAIPTKPKPTTNTWVFQDNTLYTVNADLVYDIGSREYEQLLARIDEIIEDILLEGGKRRFFFYDFIEDESKRGTQDTFNNLAAQSAIYADKASLGRIFKSEPWLTRLSIAESTQWLNWKSLGDKTTKDLANVLQDAIGKGVSSRETARLITKRLKVSRSDARRIAQTSLLGVYREAGRKEAESADEKYNIKTELLWTSALLPTTRKTHGRRHGRTYTREEVEEFYSKDGNSFFCYCSQTPVLIEDNKPVISKMAIKRMNAEKSKWEKSQGMVQ
jgi:hypothetical protein